MNARTLLIASAAALACAALALHPTPSRPAPPARAANATAPPASGAIRCEGRVTAYPGADITVAAEYGGRIEQLPVHELDRVRAGQVLARLDSREQEAALAAARARVRELDADLGFLTLEQGRQARLLAEGAVGQRSFDDVDAKLKLAQAQRDSAQAEVEQRQAVLAKLTLVAPFTGTIVERFPQPGEQLAAGGRVVRLADLARLRVEAEVDEYDLPRIRLGGPAEVEVEGRAGRIQGRVEEVPAAVSQRDLKALDPARPSDIRVALVKISLPADTGLKLGQRVELAIQD
jgi:RND family efflux transporter MFP subunit